jgi:hypothetical protein
MTTRQEDESGGRNGGVLEMLGAGGVPQWSVWKGSHLAGFGEMGKAFSCFAEVAYVGRAGHGHAPCPLTAWLLTHPA